MPKVIIITFLKGAFKELLFFMHNRTIIIYSNPFQTSVLILNDNEWMADFYQTYFKVLRVKMLRFFVQSLNHTELT